MKDWDVFVDSRKCFSLIDMNSILHLITKEASLLKHSQALNIVLYWKSSYTNQCNCFYSLKNRNTWDLINQLKHLL